MVKAGLDIRKWREIVMKKVVLLAAVCLCLVSEGYAFPVHTSRLSEACVPEQQAPQIDDQGANANAVLIRADALQVNAMVVDLLLEAGVPLNMIPQHLIQPQQRDAILLDAGFDYF
jgi:hypothetical protein